MSVNKPLSPATPPDELRERWRRQVRSALDETATSWVTIVTGVDHAPRILPASSVENLDAKEQDEIDAVLRPSRAGITSTPMAIAAHSNRISRGDIRNDEAWGFSLLQIELWSRARRHRAELEYLRETEGADSLHVELLEKLQKQEPELRDYNFEMLDAISALFDRQSETTVMLDWAATHPLLCSQQHATDAAAIVALCSHMDRAFLQPSTQSSGTAATWSMPDTTLEARERRFQGWINSLSTQIQTTGPSDMGTIVVTKMLLESLLSGRRRRESP